MKTAAILGHAYLYNQYEGVPPGITNTYLIKGLILQPHNHKLLLSKDKKTKASSFPNELLVLANPGVGLNDSVCPRIFS